MMDTPEWILQPSPPNRPTEIFLSVEIGISPSCVWDGRDEGWTGQVYAGPYKTEVGTCSDLSPQHYQHDTQEEAWACAEVHAQLIAEQVMANGAEREAAKRDGLSDTPDSATTDPIGPDSSR